MSPQNQITLSATIADDPRPGQGRTALFRLEHRAAFQGQGGDIQTTSFVLWCRARGHAAASVLKYGRPGLDIIVSGRLAYLAETNAIGIIADSVSYPRPSQLAKSEKSGQE